MFDIGSSELLLIAVVALIVIGPKDLPRVLNQIGKWVAKARAMTGHIRSGLETMAREAELEDMEKQWAAHNERIMAEHGDQPLDGTMAPLPDPPPLPSTEVSVVNAPATQRDPASDTASDPIGTEPGTSVRPT